mmetsp:Transcript_7731/g.18835  ORF Transcript_7731/g.18835 Transcript_7731/m.18835 type:complete len:139 (+) Transcript_7731:95-511(+)
MMAAETHRPTIRSTFAHLSLATTAAFQVSDVQLPLATALLAVCTQVTFAEFLERAGEVFYACDTRKTLRVSRNVLCLTLQPVMTLEQDSGNFAVPPARLVDALLAARLGNEGTLDIGEFLARVFGGCMAFSEFALADG